MLTIEWRLALATLVILPLWVFPTVRVGQVMRRLMREWHDEMGEMTAEVIERKWREAYRRFLSAPKPGRPHCHSQGLLDQLAPYLPHGLPYTIPTRRKDRTQASH